MRWSILTLTFGKSREQFLQKLLDNLQPQLNSDIQHFIKVFDKKYSIGENKAIMIEEAQGDYINFVDDDDLVAENYASSIYPLLDGVDYIGFQCNVYSDGVFTLPAYHSLKYGSWYNRPDGYYRDISHLNPMKKSLAIQGRMREGGNTLTEDRMWGDNLRNLGVVKTEHYIPRIMYFYYYRTVKND